MSTQLQQVIPIGRPLVTAAAAVFLALRFAEPIALQVIAAVIAALVCFAVVSWRRIDASLIEVAIAACAAISVSGLEAPFALAAVAAIEVSVLSLTVARTSDGRTMPLTAAGPLFLAVLLQARMIGSEHLLGELLVMAGSAALLFAVSENGRQRSVRLEVLASVTFLMLVAPAFPLRAATIPVVAAVAFLAMRQGWVAGVIALLFSVVAGKWALAIGLLPLVRLAFVRVPAENGMQAVPYLSGTAAVSRLFFVDPSLPVRAAVSEPWRRVGFAILLVAMVVTARPQLVVVYFAVAALLIFTDAIAVPRSGPLVFAVAALMLLLPWSGAAVSLPPWSGGWKVAAMLAIIAVAASWNRWFVSLAAAGAAVLAAAMLRPVTLDLYDPNETVGAGGSVSVPFLRPATRFDVFVSGANVSGLAQGTEVGRVEIVFADGGGESRPLRIGDLADWGAFNAENVFATHNPVVARSGGFLTGTGRGAFLRGGGRIEIVPPRPAIAVRVKASTALESNQRLMLERIEVRER